MKKWKVVDSFNGGVISHHNVIENAEKARNRHAILRYSVPGSRNNYDTLIVVPGIAEWEFDHKLNAYHWMWDDSDDNDGYTESENRLWEATR